MDEKRRMEGFRALVASEKSGSHFLEESDGTLRRWPELSARASSIMSLVLPPCMMCRSSSSRQWRGPSLVAQAALRVALDYRKELHGLGKLLPDDGRTESTPLVERFQEILNYQPPDRAGLLAYDMAESVKTQLESFLDEFERLAKTREQKKLVAAFKEFVGEVTAAGMTETFDKLLARYAEGERQAPERVKDSGIER